MINNNKIVVLFISSPEGFSCCWSAKYILPLLIWTSVIHLTVYTYTVYILNYMLKVVFFLISLVITILLIYYKAAQSVQEDCSFIYALRQACLTNKVDFDLPLNLLWSLSAEFLALRRQGPARAPTFYLCLSTWRRSCSVRARSCVSRRSARPNTSIKLRCSRRIRCLVSKREL